MLEGDFKMNGWVIVVICMIPLFIISIGMLVFVYWDIKKMTQQLEGIIEDFGTNELIRTNTHHKALSQFAMKINQLIHLFKQNQQYQEKRETQLKQEITNISHDLRTPLTSIKGFSALLTDPELSEAEKKAYVAIIQTKIDVLTIQVDSFYELSSIDSLDSQLIMEKLSLDQMIGEKMLLFYNDFERKQLKVAVNVLPEVPILANEKAVNRIMINMIQNALRYAKTYFTIEMMEEEMYIRVSAMNDVHEFNDAEIRRIFDRSFRMDTSRTDSQLGLGLHIVQQLVEKQGGKVIADVHEDEFRIDVYFKKWA